jgi:serine/threonine-protein kinase
VLSTAITRHRTPSPSDSSRGRFATGDVLAARYRIVERIGKGGMGEVYHADDLTLEQPVALKLLPEAFATNPDWLKYFRREVRIARQIAHPNICRVYDIGEAEGLVFFTMEYIDGEDLSSLLRRIGRLPPDKGIEISRQLASGLAAAHDRGVLHRDLKPSNIMLDERGQARITDFGLAAAAGAIEKDDIRSGTPGYMAPEQWAGKEVTEKSDLYSLGLVLYELFTGKRAFEGKTPQELGKRRCDSKPTSPSSVIKGLEPSVERVILKCLEPDPKDRPANALEVRAAFPGGDLLASAVAAGKTPAPALVAEAGEGGALRPAIAWACLGAVLVSLPLIFWMSSLARLNQIVPLPRSPAFLAADARGILESFGYTDLPRDTTYGFSRHTGYIDRSFSLPFKWRGGFSELTTCRSDRKSISSSGDSTVPALRS